MRAMARARSNLRAPEQGLARPDVALRQRDGLDLLKLFEKSVGHG